MSARKLPSLSALRAFEAAARHRSAKMAAQELSVTPTAISHQLRQLEDYLGVALFVRKPRQLVLTGAGQTLLAASSEAFDTLAETVARLRHNPGHQTVTLSTIPAVAGRFLLPWVCLLRDTTTCTGTPCCTTSRPAIPARCSAGPPGRSWPGCRTWTSAPARCFPTRPTPSPPPWAVRALP